MVGINEARQQNNQAGNLIICWCTTSTTPFDAVHCKEQSVYCPGWHPSPRIGFCKKGQSHRHNFFQIVWHSLVYFYCICDDIFGVLDYVFDTWKNSDPLSFGALCIVIVFHQSHSGAQECNGFQWKLSRGSFGALQCMGQIHV